MARSAAEPRHVVGSVDTSETAVAFAATAGFLLGMGFGAFDLAWVLPLMIGGAIAAPIAAWLVRLVPPHILGTLVGGSSC